MNGPIRHADTAAETPDTSALEAAGITRLWARFIFEDGVPAVELIVETSAETRPDAPGFDRSKIDQIVATALRLDTGGNYDRIIVEPQRS